MEKTKSTKRLMIILATVSVLMFGFGFAMVPIYSVLCKVTGLNGKTGGAVNYNNEFIDESRIITVEFLATNNEGLDWEFRPLDKKITLHPGEIKRTAYFAKNNTNKTMAVQAIPSVTPGLAARHIKKTECFCFERQVFKAHQEMEMPLLFHLDADLPKNINTLTLSYTLFDLSRFEKKG